MIGLHYFVSKPINMNKTIHKVTKKVMASLDEAPSIQIDIEMGDGNAFDVLDMLDEVREKIILVTGSKEYAIKAFRYNAVDYLLKPVDHEDLRQAVGKILKKDKNNLDADVQDKLSLSTSDEIKIVKKMSAFLFCDLLRVV